MKIPVRRTSPEHGARGLRYACRNKVRKAAVSAVLPKTFGPPRRGIGYTTPRSNAGAHRPRQFNEEEHVMSRHSISRYLPVALMLAAFIFSAATAAAVPFMSLPVEEDKVDVYFYRQVEIPDGKIVRAWSAIDPAYEHVLYINGHEAARSRQGRVSTPFRRAMDIQNLQKHLKPGTNTLAMKVHRWSFGPGPAPAVYLQAEVQVETANGVVAVPIIADTDWVGSYSAPSNWTAADFKPEGWQPVTINNSPTTGPRMRLRRDHRKAIAPDVPAPLPKPALDAFPQIAAMSDWQQQVVARPDVPKETERLMGIFHTKFIAEIYANAIRGQNTHMGDSYTISAYPVGNGIVLTFVGPYPFYNSTGTVGPEYQYPVQWNPGSTFGGDAVSVTTDGKPLGIRNQWMWKIRKTDVAVSAAADPAGEVVFYTLTFAPPNLKALIRVYLVANASAEPLKNVVVTNRIIRAKADGKRLTDTVTHHAMADAAGDANTRTMVSGVLDNTNVTASYDENSHWGALTIPLGDIAPGASAKALVYHITFLETLNGEPVKSDAAQTYDRIRARGYGLLDDTIKYWRDYNAATTALEAPGRWGRRVADFIDDEKMLVQVQQFQRTGAVGPMWFFSDQWIRDACGPVRSYLRTGAFTNARRVLDYHYLSAIACRKILNWLPMDVSIYTDHPPVEDWSTITMNYADRHANCEVASWIILKHAWYFQFTGDTKTIAEHWEYLKRCFYGQFDNEHDKIFRPDFKIPFHGDETFIYSGGEALWANRYDIRQTSYPGGNIYSADSSFELVAAGDALVTMGKAIGKVEDAGEISEITARIREATEKYYWMNDLGFYAQGMSVLFDGQLNRYPMGNILANVIWSGYGSRDDPKAVSTAVRMTEYLMEDSGVFNPTIGITNTVGMLQGQGLYALAGIHHPWAEKAFYALLMIAGDTTEFSEWMNVGADYRTMFRANRVRPWEGGINLDALLYYLSGLEPDAFNKRMTLTPCLPTGVYSPIKWDTMTLRHLPMGRGSFDLNVADTEQGRRRRRTYTLASRSPDDVTVTLNALVPFAKVDRVVVNGRAARVKPGDVFSQALATTTTPLRAGRTLTIAVDYTPLPAEPVAVDLKPFKPTEPTFDSSDVVVFTHLRPAPNTKVLRDVLAEKCNVLALDSSLPTDAATFKAALLTGSGLRTRMLVMNQSSMMAGRKYTFWWDPQFDEVIGTFLKRGGVVVEVSSGNPSSKWLEKTLAPSTFWADYSKPGDILAMDTPDPDLDRKFYWLDEKQTEGCGKWSAYWAGSYTMRYIDDKLEGHAGPLITDRALIWGKQEQPHGCMQYTMKTTPGKDHLIRIRSWPFPKKGFTLEVVDKDTKQWKVIETVWVPQPKDPKINGYIDVFLTLPAEYVSDAETSVFRIGQPEGSAGGIGAIPSTAASRIWIRDNTDKPPSMAEISTSSAYAGKLGLPDKGAVSYSSGRITFTGFAAPYRMLGDSEKAALILKPVGKGLYVKTDLTALFPVEQMAAFLERLLDPSTRKAVVSDLRISD